MFQNSSYAASGRLLMAILFILSGIGKIAAPEATQGFIASAGLPLPLPMLGYLLAIVVEVGGGIMLLVGFQARPVSLVLALFTIVAGLLFHHNFADQNQMIHFMKNLAVVGGLFQVAAFGAGTFSFDARRQRATLA